MFSAAVKDLRRIDDYFHGADLTVDRFRYTAEGLVEQFTRAQATVLQTGDSCWSDPEPPAALDWRYLYSPGMVREQKRESRPETVVCHIQPPAETARCLSTNLSGGFSWHSAST